MKKWGINPLVEGLFTDTNIVLYLNKKDLPANQIILNAKLLEILILDLILEMLFNENKVKAGTGIASRMFAKITRTDKPESNEDFRRNCKKFFTGPNKAILTMASNSLSLQLLRALRQREIEHFLPDALLVIDELIALNEVYEKNLLGQDIAGQMHTLKSDLSLSVASPA